MYAIKNDLTNADGVMQNETLNKALADKLKWLEYITRETLKKVIRLNHFKKEQLLQLLDKRFIQTHL